MLPLISVETLQFLFSLDTWWAIVTKCSLLFSNVASACFPLKALPIQKMHWCTQCEQDSVCLENILYFYLEDNIFRLSAILFWPWVTVRFVSFETVDIVQNELILLDTTSADNIPGSFHIVHHSLTHVAVLHLHTYFTFMKFISVPSRHWPWGTSPVG